MVGRQCKKTVDRLRSEYRFPVELPSVAHDPLVAESKRNRKFTCVGFGNLGDPDREAVTFFEVAKYSVCSWMNA